MACISTEQFFLLLVFNHSTQRIKQLGQQIHGHTSCYWYKEKILGVTQPQVDLETRGPASSYDQLERVMREIVKKTKKGLFKLNFSYHSHFSFCSPALVFSKLLWLWVLSTLWMFVNHFILTQFIPIKGQTKAPIDNLACGQLEPTFEPPTL